MQNQNHAPRYGAPTNVWDATPGELSPLQLPQSPANWGRQPSNPQPVGGLGGWPTGSESSESSWTTSTASTPYHQHQQQQDGFSSMAWRPPSPGMTTTASEMQARMMGTPYGQQSALFTPSTTPASSPALYGDMAQQPQNTRQKGRSSFSLRGKEKDDKWWARAEQEYNEFNLAQRPRDWRQEYEVRPSLLKKLGSPKNRSDMREISDPVKRVPHSLMAFQPSRYPISFDIRFSPLQNTEDTLFPYLGRRFNHIDLVQLATTPPTQFLRLFHPRYPWYIDVRSSEPNGVTISDVLEELWRSFSMPIQPRHYWCDELTSEDRAKLNQAYSLRCQQAYNPELTKQRGVIQADFLGMYQMLRFQGVVRSKLGMWEMKLTTVEA
ncbi:hypothetical protein CYLTODRAFT_418664 [Cylindrobasidium torrendii FP15055 ss-10]|uniref:DUF6699 domain-containing protein n=1 Tax=Cylindrobasidium torrendii FP15055 ss-10 TaxID=1314674 RepID=A0A0D7BPR9_9AGAR|nr:hypothetical protein CYLTODRAFT_418664 [Cylindrobasidium torrendii FP15055 ss-10]